MTPTKTDVRPARSPASAKKTMQLPRSPWLTLLLLLAVGVMISGFSLAFSGSEGISWGEAPSCSSGTPCPSCSCWGWCGWPAAFPGWRCW
ncbi:MAG: hypothetical protein ACLUNZ_01755 [Evtepia sp.]